MSIYTVTVEHQIRMDKNLSELFGIEPNTNFEEYSFEHVASRGYFQSRVKGMPSNNKGVPMSLERLETHRKAMLGHRVSDETKAKMSAAKRGKSPKQNSYIAVCPHCGKEGQRVALGRWHFDNCKQRK